MKKLGRPREHRLSLLRNLATELFKHEAITTTLAKAKELRSFSEKLITTAKRKGITPKRRVAVHIKDKEAFQKLFSNIAPRYKTRPGGYTRIIKLSKRAGDGAQLARIELV